MNLAELKASARKQAAMRRKSAHAADDGSVVASVEKRLWEESPLGDKAVISGFLPIGSELDLRPLLANLAARGRKTVLPCVVGKDRPLVFRLWQEGDLLVKEGLGTLAPSDEAQICDPDILLVPMPTLTPRACNCIIVCSIPSKNFGGS